MVDMGVAITLLIKKWVDAHGLTMKEKAAEYHLRRQQNSGQDHVGMTSMTLLLVLRFGN